MKRWPLYLSFIVFGISTLTIQIVLIRELLVIFSGNELSIGLFLSQWLLAQAIGSYLFSKIPLRNKKPVKIYIGLFTAFTGIFPAIIFMIRIIKPLMGILPGEQVSFFTLSLISFCIFLLPGIFGGAVFSIACRMFAAHDNDSVRNLSWVYLLEAAGCLLGGLIVSNAGIGLIYPFQTAFVIIALSWLSVIVVDTGVSEKATGTTWMYSLAIILLVIFWILRGVEGIRNESLRVQWHPYQVKDYYNTVYGNIVILERSGQQDILMSGTPIAHLPTPDIINTEEVAHLAMLAQPAPHSVLLLGNGADGIIPEILKHPVTHLVYIEPDSVLLSRMAHFSTTSGKISYDSRLNIIYSDAREHLSKFDRKYDLIILNFPEPSTLSINRFYTSDFFSLCRQHLTPSGILFLRIPSSATYLNEPALQLNASIIRSATEIFGNIFLLPDDYTTIYLSDSTLSLSDPDLWIKRLTQRDLKTRFISPAYFQVKLDSLKHAWYTGEIGNVAAKLNSDLHPVAVWYSLSMWISAHQPELIILTEMCNGLRMEYILIFILVAGLIIFLLTRRNQSDKRPVIYFSVFTSGFTGLSLSILFALLFQACYGYVFFWLGFLVAGFMAGLALGTWFSGVKRQLSDYRYLVYLELVFTILLMLILSILAFELHIHILPVFKYMILLLAAVSGAVVGAEFPVSSELNAGSKREYARTAGRIYATDLAGACLGGILTAVLFIPVLGIIATMYILICIKFTSILLLWYLRPKIRNAAI